MQQEPAVGRGESQRPCPSRPPSAALAGKSRPELFLASLFGAFVFLQFTVLGLANHAGEGYLAAEQRDLVYYALQVFVILGYLLHCLLFRFCAGKRVQSTIAYGVFCAFFVCAAAMLAVDRDSAGNVVASMAAALFLGAIGGAVHYRMSRETVTGTGVARCMGLGSAVAVAMQYLLQIQWGETPFLPVFMLAAFVALLVLLLREAPGIDVVEGGARKPTPPKRIAVAALITAIFILFAVFYNEYIHHLMIRSNYASFSVYSWPRLMLVPGYLLFAAIGDKKNGRYVPLVSLCIMLMALLNVILVGDQGTYWLNMCLFYFAIAAFTSYYLLTFWRLAPGTGHPAFWAPFGRMLDSAVVLLAGAVHLSALPAPAILGLDVAGVAIVIVLMALGGDFNLTEAPTVSDGPTAEETASTLEQRTSLLARECGLTDREREVLEALVLTEDKNQQIAEKLFISRRQLQRHVSSIYEKTDATSRAGLIARVYGNEESR